MNMRLVVIMAVLTAVLATTELNTWRDVFFLFQQALRDFIFPKDPNIMRVRNSEQARAMKHVTILDFIGLVERYNYSAEEHHVTTEDGYNLLIHRISGSPQSDNNQGKKVVFLQHGVLCTSDCWVVLGAEKNLAFLLADYGYDVWLGNLRGNSYCRSHVTMSPRNRDFWQFSYHESGLQDLPVMIDYVLNYTGRKQLTYIGHSMGSTILYVLLSTRPEYNEKISFAISLAPVAFWNEYPPIFGNILNNAPRIKEFLDANEIYEILALTSTSITTGKILCANGAITQPLCSMLYFLFSGSDPAQLNTTALPDLLSYFPCGTSANVLLHYYQNILTGDFQSFDYGFIGNEKYKQRNTTTYNLKRITTPLALFYGLGDAIVLKANVLRLYKQLPNVVLLEENPYKFFTHMDFIWAIDGKVLFYDRLLEVLQKFGVENNQKAKVLHERV